MAPCRVFKYYKKIYCSKNLAENPEKFWAEYSNRLVGLGQVASLTKSGQEPSKRLVLPKIKNSLRLPPPLDFHHAMPHTPSQGRSFCPLGGAMAEHTKPKVDWE